MIRQWFGAYQGVVVRNNDPEDNQRVIISVPQVLGTANSQWATPASATTGISPVPGTRVTVMFIGGDVNHPAYLSEFTAATNSGVIDTNSADIQPLGVRAAGNLGLASDAKHVHAMPSIDQLNVPAANVAWNAHKITGLANGSSAQDAAAFGQIPTALPPNGSASGDLSGSYPGPAVAKVSGSIGSVTATGVAATDYANLQAAFNAGGQVRLDGAYNIGNNTLTFSQSNTFVQGAGWSTQIQWDATGGIACMAMVDTTYRRIFIRDIRITQTSSSAVGTGIDASYFQNSPIERVLIDGSTKNPNIGVSFNAASCFYNVLSDSRINCDGTSGIGVRFDSGANSNVVRNCRILPSTIDATQIGVYVNSNTIKVDHVDIENAAGTAISVGASGHACTIVAPYIESCGTHFAWASGASNPTIFGGTSLTPTTAMLADSGAIAPSIIDMRSGTATPYTKAVFQQPATLGQILRVINRTGSPSDVALRIETLNGGELALGARATSDSANRWEIDSAGKQQWGPGSGSPDTNLYRSAVDVLTTDGSLSVGVALSANGNAICAPQPSDMGYLAWTFDPVTAGGTGTALPVGQGVIELIKIPLWGQSFSTTGVTLDLTALGSSLTSTENWIYLFNSAGTFVAATADQTTTWNTGGTTGTADIPWVSGPFTISGSFCWIGLVWNGSGSPTAPAFLRGSSNTAKFANGRLSAAASRYGSIGASKTTNTPGNFTPSSISQNAPAYWAAIY